MGILMELGNECGRPISAHLQDGIFEFRANQVRLLYFFGDNRQIVFVHNIVKKTGNVPPREIKLAKTRRKEVQKGGSLNAFTFPGSPRIN
jgi:phage-related protein